MAECPTDSFSETEIEPEPEAPGSAGPSSSVITGSDARLLLYYDYRTFIENFGLNFKHYR